MNSYFFQKLSELFTYNSAAPLLFNSLQFLVLFTLFISIYALIYNTKLIRAIYVVLFSLFFYYKSSGWYLILLVASIIFNFWIAKKIFNEQQKTIKKLLLTFSIIANLSLLGYFKYTNFILQNISFLKGQEVKPLDIFLPIGISFFTFQAMSYVIDVYRNKIKPDYSLLDFAFYISYFPQLVAGPIVRATSFLPQLRKRITISNDDIWTGMFLIMQGLFKKAVIADYISQYNDLIFSSPQNYSGFENMMAVYGYALQIYCDFSGYSDIAIGIGRMMGFDLGINFLKPYQAINITDFWRRWHISLSQWLKDYLYIPLGGNRKGKIRTYVNLFITMLLGGLWHGAAWKFVIWGGMHGVGLAVHKVYCNYIKDKFKLHPIIKNRFVSWFITFHFVSLLWIFFRANSQHDAFLIFQKLSDINLAYFIPFWVTRPLFVVLLLIGFLIHAIPVKTFDFLTLKFIRLPFIVKALSFIILIQLIIQLQTEGVQPFIYFQF